MVPQMTKVKLFGNHLMSRLVSRIARRRIHDVSCGFRAYSRDAALRLNLFGNYTYTQECILDLADYYAFFTYSMFSGEVPA